MTESTTPKYIEREAKLFEAGEYADKGLERPITEEDLDRIASGTPEAPIKIEHMGTAFDGALGTLSKVWRNGKELFGKIQFPVDVWTLMQRTGAKKLSVGLKRDLSGLTEVSIVNSPRIADAAVFKNPDLIPFSADVVGEPAEETTPADQKQTPITPEEVKPPMSDETKVEMSYEEALRIVQERAATDKAAAQLLVAQQENIAFAKASQQTVIDTAKAQKELNEHLRAANAEQLIAKFKREGKITPAAEPYARAIFAVKPLIPAYSKPEECLTFKKDNESEPEQVHFADLVEQMLNALPAFVTFAEIVRNEQEEMNKLTPEQEEVARKMGALDSARKYA